MKPIESHEKEAARVEAPKQPWQTPRLRSLNERGTESPPATFHDTTEWHSPGTPYLPGSASYGPS